MIATYVYSTYMIDFCSDCFLKINVEYVHTYVYYFRELINVSLVATSCLTYIYTGKACAHPTPSGIATYEYDATKLVAISCSMGIACLTEQA